MFCTPPNRDTEQWQMLSACRLKRECKLIRIDVIPGEINEFFQQLQLRPSHQFIKRFAWGNCRRHVYWCIFITFQLGIESSEKVIPINQQGSLLKAKSTAWRRCWAQGQILSQISTWYLMRSYALILKIHRNRKYTVDQKVANHFLARRLLLLLLSFLFFVKICTSQTNSI